MSALSRRSIIASAAALPALAVPAVAMTSVPAAKANSLPIGDAWVDRLKPEFDRVLDVWHLLYALNGVHHDIWEDYDVDLDLWSALSGRLNPLVDEILEQKATTFIGLALQAQAFAVSKPEEFFLCDDFREPLVREFAVAVCAFLKIVPAPLISLDADGIARFKSDLIARLKAKPINENNRDEILGDLLAARSTI